MSYGELAEATNRIAAGLRRLGIGPGDRVGVFMPMVPEVAIATLACGKIGAIFTPIFSGYAAPAVAARLRDCGARALITADRALMSSRWDWTAIGGALLTSLIIAAITMPLATRAFKRAVSG